VPCRTPRTPAAPRRPTTGEAWRQLGIAPNDRQAQEFYLETDQIYGKGSPYSYFADLAHDQLARRTVLANDGAAIDRGDPFPAGQRPGTLEDARARLATVEKRDVTSGDPGALSFLGPGYIGDAFNTAARPEGSLATALGIQPLPEGVRRIDIPRWDTGASAAVPSPEGSNVSQTDVDAASQAGNIGTVAGRQTLSVQGAEFMDPAVDVALGRELGNAVAQALDAQLIAGTNANQQTLGLAAVTGIKSVVWTDASPTSQEFVGQTWKAYNEIAGTTGGQGTASPDEYITVMHPRRLAWSYHNPQNAQSIAPAVPDRIVPCASLRTNLGAGTNEDEVFVLSAAELPVYATSVRLLIDEESVSGNMQIRVVAYAMVGTGFGRAPGAISRISGSGLIAPAL
jgi:hypothetical protein